MLASWYLTSKVSFLKRLPWHDSHSSCRSAMNCISMVTLPSPLHSSQRPPSLLKLKYLYSHQDIIKSADFIFTNPPFHGYREIVKLICSYKKPFLFYCAQSSLSYKLINEYKCVYIDPAINGGKTTQWFMKPDGSIRNCGVCYITNVREAYKPVPFHSPKRISCQMKSMTYYEPYVKGYIERCSLINDDGEDYHKVGDIFSIPAIQMIHLDYSKYRILGEASSESNIHFYYSIIVEKIHD